MITYSTLSRVCIASSAVVFAALLPGCAQHHVTSDALSYNKALGNAGDRMILANIVRASQRRPLYFAAIGKLSTAQSVNGQLGLSLPLGSDGQNLITANPSVSGTRGTNTAEFTNLNTAEFAQSMNLAVDASVFAYFHNNGWAREVIFNMFVGRVVLSHDLDNRIREEANRRCSRPIDERTRRMCNNLYRALLPVGEKCDVDENSFDATKVTYFNTARQACAYAKFQVLSRRLRIIQAELMPRRTELVLSIPARSGQRGFVLTTLENRQNRLILRSPIAMINYLGGHAAAQLYGPPDRRRVPTIGIGASFRPVALFRVEEGVVTGNEAVSVTIGKRRYSIPNPEFGTRSEDRSLQALSLLSQVIAVNTDPEDLAQSSQVRLITN